VPWLNVIGPRYASAPISSPATVRSSSIRKKIANWQLVLPGIAAQASGDEVLKTVAAFRNGCDVIQCGGESGKLLIAIAALVGIPLVHSNPVLSDIVEVDISGADLSSWFWRSPFGTELPARLNFIGDEHSIGCTIPVRLTFFPNSSES